MLKKRLVVNMCFSSVDFFCTICFITNQAVVTLLVLKVKRNILSYSNPTLLRLMRVNTNLKYFLLS